ncbi:MAG: phosphotransferase family protein [Desulfobacteraceae bacterium]|nr:phosphotransferase family protein [Desulfobacteraceae bacterium]
MDNSDQARDTRPGEGLDSAGVEAFLKDSIPGLQGRMAIQQFPSGHSNLTYLITFGDREMVLRRPPLGTKAKTAHDMGREYRVLSALNEAYPYCPRTMAYTEDTSIIGCPFYVMERIKGIVVRREFPPGIGESPGKISNLCRKLIEVQHELHTIDYRKVGLENFGKPVGYVERQVNGWSERYRAARTPDAPDCEDVMAWLQDKMPPDSSSPAIIHNDFKLDNVVLDPGQAGKIIGVLDWEMATLGDPLMDLGGSLGYWVEKNDPPEMQAIRFMPTDAEGALTRDELVGYYAQLSGRPIDNYDFYYCFGLFRLAVIAQQIYYRYYRGQTKDKRFEAFIFGVLALDKTARLYIEKSSL